jgi:ribosomal protein S18 acetylase RimI-like enzyme
MPRSAIEAAAMGRPMVLTDIRGCREVARHEREALLVPVRDPDRLAAAIERLLSNDELRRRLGAAARARALERFDEARVAEVVLGHTRRLLARAGLGALSALGSVDGVRIRPARPDDVSAIARLHRRTMPTAFLPSLGEGFLRGLYRSLVSERGTSTLVADLAGRVVGFAAGTTSVRGSYRRFVVRRGLPAAVSAVPALVHPGVLRRGWETARYPARAERLPDAELLAIAVDPSWGGRGVGRALAEGVLRELGDLGAGEAKVVVATANARANRFYERIGFRSVERIRVHGGEESTVWVIRCPPSS